ncbi:TIGR02186 family protein [Telmatospirillum sp. J64-1]|uniref:TIGR02186 family protein n=1 Tax=Telmatospirillum sp. J64-1 TaxID=2502183 RepID=UPI002106525D|nr:TIGR02186 family protein [Telmatospirillum sp. J64-1]
MFDALHRLLSRILLLVGLGLVMSGPAQTQEPLVADLSRHLVPITTGFAGTEVLLFGAVDEPGDIVMVVRGPTHEPVVRRLARISGIWVTRSQIRVGNVPSFYRVASTAPLETVASPSVLQRHQIGLANLDFTIERTDSGAEPQEYHDALIRLKQKEGLFNAEVQPIDVLGNRLFRSTVYFPANVPVGTYSVEVYLLRDGQVVSAQTTPLIISKIGLGADVYDFAHQQSAAYGLIAILLAVASGWLAAVAFKKG